MKNERQVMKPELGENVLYIIIGWLLKRNDRRLNSLTLEGWR